MDMQALMKQAQELQKKVAEAQDQLDHVTVKGIAASGMCIVEMTGKYDVLNITINPELLGEEIGMVQDVIKAAMNDAKTKADAIIDRVMSAATAGIPLPGQDD